MSEEIKIPADLFIHEMKETSKIFGRDSKVEVVFSGSQAGCSGNTIYYPSIDRSEELTETEVKIGRGYVDHEAAHIRYTDLEFFAAVATACENKGCDLLKVLTNSIEDVRIERLVNFDYLGAKKNLSATSSAVNEMFLEAAKEDPDMVKNPQNVAGVAMTWEGRKRMEYDTDTNQKCLDVIDDKLVRSVEKWVSEIDKCSSVQDSYILARKIYDLLGGKEEDKPNAEDLKNAARQNNMGDKPIEAKFGEGESEDGEGEVAGIGLDDDDEDLYFPEDDSYGPRKLWDVDFSSYIEEMNKNKLAGDEENLEPYRAYSTEYDRMHHRKDLKTGAHPTSDRVWNAGYHMNRTADIKKYNELLDETAGSINTMRRKLERAIQAKAKRDWDVCKEQGRLDSKRLVGAFQGNPAVYKERIDSSDLDTAVSILVDHSGSMKSDRKTHTSILCTVALFECLTKIGVPFEVTGFNNMSVFPNETASNKYYRDRHGAARDVYRYQRYEPLQMYNYKNFNDRPMLAKAILPTMYNHMGGNNGDGEAVMIAGARLLERPEKRKILMVLSDGQPSCAGHGGQGRYLKEVVAKLEKKNIDLLGIGICSSAVREFYPKYAVCNNIEELPKGTMDILAKLLLGERFIIDNKDLNEMKERIG